MTIQNVQIWTTVEGESELAMTIEATIRETHSLSQDAPEHPVEQGPDVTDQIRPRNDTLALECMISNTPIMRGARMVSLGYDAAPGAGIRVPAAYEALKGLKGKLLDVVTELEKYRDMVLKTAEVTVTSETGDVLAFTATFAHVEIVTTATVRVRASAMHANGPANLGQQPATKLKKPNSWLWDGDAALLGGALRRLAGKALEE